MTPVVERRRPQVPPTTRRSYIDAASHNPPQSMTDNAGNFWRGTSRIIDRPARRRSSRRSWRRLQVEARRAFVASKRVCP